MPDPKDIFNLYEQLVERNRDFTKGLRSGLRQSELKRIYDSITEIYVEIRNRKEMDLLVKQQKKELINLAGIPGSTV